MRGMASDRLAPRRRKDSEDWKHKGLLSRRGALRSGRVWLAVRVERWWAGPWRAPVRVASVHIRLPVRPGRSESQPLAERVL